MDGNHNPSSTPVRSVLVDRNSDGRNHIKQMLLASNLVDICAETTSYALAVSHVERIKPEFIFCGIDGNPQDAFSLMEKIRERNPLLRIVCIGDNNNPDTILRCFRTGADEFLVKPVQNESLQEMFTRLRSQRKSFTPSPVPERQGRVLAIWGSRGGCGVTTIACNLAHVLAQAHSTVLVDLHETQGDLGLFFDQQPTYSLQDIWGRGDRIDDALVESIALKVEGGLRLLLQSGEDRPSSWNRDDFVRMMEVLQSKFEFTILDIGCGMETAQRVFSSVDDIYLVVNQTLPSLYLASRKVRWLENAGLEEKKLNLLINAYNPRSSVTHKHIAKTLQISSWMVIRNDERTVVSAINQGIPLRSVRRWGKAGRDIAVIAKSIALSSIQAEPVKAAKDQLVIRPLLSGSEPVGAMQ